MDHFAGLDVSVKDTSICIVDDKGKIVREMKVTSKPDALLSALRNDAYQFKRIGLEAGPLSQWLFSALADVELPVMCVETVVWTDTRFVGVKKFRLLQHNLPKADVR
jgi:transposase